MSRHKKSPALKWVHIRTPRYKKPEYQHFDEYQLFINGRQAQTWNKEANIVLAMAQAKTSKGNVRLIARMKCSDGTFRTRTLYTEWGD